jgi:hypothetical protein
MNTMSFYLWLLPVLLMIHEFEEIIMIEVWHEGHKEKIDRVWPKKKPFGLDHIVPFLTPTISIGIFTEFIGIILICFLCAIFNNYYAWYGFAVGFVLNTIFLHARDVIRFKGYTPGFISSVILIIPTVWILYKANTILNYSLLEIVLSTIIINVVFAFVAFKLLHKSMPAWSASLIKYSKKEIKE